MDEVHVQAVDLRLEVREFVEFFLLLGPVVFLEPVVGDLAQVGAVEAVGEGRVDEGGLKSSQVELDAVLQIG